jgi:hypothetical protein
MQRFARILSLSAATLFTGTAFAQTSAPLLGLATGLRCESLPLVAPDNHCVVHYVHTGGPSRGAQTAMEVRCSWDDGGFQEEILRMSTTVPTLRMQWSDATHLDVGLPPDADFLPPLRKVSQPPGHTLHYDYRLAATSDAPALQCFDPPEDYRNMEQLSGPLERPAHEPRWVSFGGTQTCILMGQSGSVIPPARLIATHFTQTATARLPFGTTDLVLVISADRLDAPVRIRLAPDEPPLVPEPNGPGGGYRLTGSPAERILHTLSQRGTVELMVPGAGSTEMTRNEFGSAYSTFKSCLARFDHVRPFHP